MSIKKILAYKELIWSFFAGVSYVLCFPQWDMPYFSVLFLPALIFSVRTLKSRRQALFCGLMMSTMVAWGGFSWIVYMSQNFGGMPLPAAVGVLCLFCLVAAPQMVVFYLVAYKTRWAVELLPSYLKAAYWACLFTALEYAFHFFKIFPEHLGNTLIHYLSVAQLASLGGVALLTFLPLWLGGSFLYVKQPRGWIAAAAAVALTLGAHFWGTSQIAEIRSSPQTILRVGLVQHNIEEIEKIAARTGGYAAIEEVVRKLLELTHGLIRSEPRPDFILWPETSYPTIFRMERYGRHYALGSANLILDEISDLKIPLIMGGYESVSGSKTYNSALYIDAAGEVRDSYRKFHLLFIGEYFPLSDTFPVLKKINPQMGDFARGKGAVPIDFERADGNIVKLGLNICYEAIIPEYMRALARNGAQVFVNITKDSWYGDTFEPWQHMQLTALRAIEHRLSIVRATNTGLSGVVLPTGEVQIISRPYVQIAKVVEAPIFAEQKTTLYTKLGDWFAYFCVAFAAGALIWLRRKFGAKAFLP